MDFRAVLVIAVTGAAAVAGSSCSAPDPATVNFEARPKDEIIGADASSGGSSGSGEGGAGEAGVDGGMEGGGPITAFSGASAYDSATAGMTTGSVNANHTFGGATPMNPTTQDCLTCHKTGGTGNPWGFAGSLFQAADGKAAFTTHAEIRIVDATGKLVGSTYSDEAGNFWLDAAALSQAIPNGAMVGVRDATKTKYMATKLTGAATDGSCNNTTANCHNPGATAGGRPFLQ